MKLAFQHGSLELHDCSDDFQALVSEFLFYDSRMLLHRAEAMYYRRLILAAHSAGVAIDDYSRGYQKVELKLPETLIPRVHQRQALKAWVQHGKSGIVSLPTGAGKTILALMAMVEIQRSTLIVVPTIDLIHQWVGVLKKHFALSVVGILGDGRRDIQEITVATYDSARLCIETLGARFGFLIVDECHHLPAGNSQLIARGALAPFRLGLSATVERADGREEVLDELLGHIVYQVNIAELAGGVLAPYDVVTVEVELSAEERAQYVSERGLYTSFLRQQGIQMSKNTGWQQFIMRSAQSAVGRRAFKAYLAQKKLAQASQAKFAAVWDILSTHSGASVIIFTDRNSLAYQIGEMFFLPVVTHKTSSAEREELLTLFRSGKLDVIVTSKALNEGVDVPCASVGIVVSGSGTVREHVQRLGRVLRQAPGKRAVLYEVVAKDTAEQYVNHRRRNHDAYQRTH